MKIATKIHVLLAYTIFATEQYALAPDSRLLSVPYAMLIIRILETVAVPVWSVGNILLVPAKDPFTAPYVVRMLDVCVGFFLLAFSGLFLWLRGASRILISVTVCGLFLLNTFRVVLVVFLLRTSGYALAAAVHDLFYAGFTALAIAIIVYGAYGAYRLLNPPASGLTQLSVKRSCSR